ncbi:hypothetical protein [Streptomyces bauhiniae]|uniref:hypothetical protein n=1 Tax=Streptomyces bauhiniae TaxID=2340725 RepID=UPI0035DED970
MESGLRTALTLEKTRAGADLSLRADLTLTALAEAKFWPVARSQEIIREAKTATRSQRYEHAAAPARAALDPVRETCNSRKLHDQG